MKVIWQVERYLKGGSAVVLVSSEQMRELDRMVQKMGVSALLLMENAGRALAHHSMDLLDEGEHFFPKGIEKSSRAAHMTTRHAKRGTIVVLAGPGQNGSDGFCAARHLAAHGYEVKVGLFGKKEDLPYEASLNYEVLRAYPIEVLPLDFENPQATVEQLGSPDLVIDALLGIGTKGPPRFPIDLAVKWANSQGVPIVACDIPTGISADTGEVYEPCIRANTTVTMGYAKIGLLSYPGRMFAGNVVVENLSFPRDLVAGSAEPVKIDMISENIQCTVPAPLEIMTQAVFSEDVRPLFPQRQEDHHKGLSGHVMVIAGSLGMAGASVLCAKSALRAGAGTVTLVCPGKIYEVCASAAPEVMVLPYGDSKAFTPDPKSFRMVKDKLEKTDAIAIGPGWGRGPSQTEFLKEMLPFVLNIPCVVDADALFALAELGGLAYLEQLHGEFILTPHPGEMAILRSMGVSELNRDRPAVARRAAMESGSVVCLKGAGTCTAGPRGELFINTSGTAAMATAGSGDVLTGVIAGLGAQGLAALDSAVVGVFWHGTAGEMAHENKGSYGILAGDIVDYLPYSRAAIESGQRR